MSSNKQVSHPRHQRPTLSDAGRGREKGVNPKTDRGWGGAGAVGWGVLGAFGSIDKDTGAQVVRKTTDSNVKMVKNDKGLWVKVRVDEAAPSSGRGRGRGIPALGGGEPVIGGLQDEAYGSADIDESPPRSSRDGRRGSRSPSRSREKQARRRSPSRSRSREKGAGSRSRERKDKGAGSRSRSRERKEKRRRSRSASRSRGRKPRHSRSKSRSRSPRHKSSKRSRSRSKGRRERRGRSRERRDRRRERRSRSHSRSPRGKGKGRERSGERGDRKVSAERERPGKGEGRRERSAERERGKERERERKPSPAKAERMEQEEEGPPPVMNFTAAQLADRLVEVYNLESSQRLSQIMACFHPSVVLSNLKTRADVLKGAQALRDSMPSDFAKWDADCTRRLYMEKAAAAGGQEDGPSGQGGEGPTFCLDFYPAGHAPGVNAMGKGGVRLSTVLLYRVDKNLIEQVWIAPDKEGLAEGDNVGEGKVRGSKIYAAVAEVLKAQYGEGVEIAHVFNDYRDIEVLG